MSKRNRPVVGEVVDAGLEGFAVLCQDQHWAEATLRMYREHDEGVGAARVEDHRGGWWVFVECSNALQTQVGREAMRSIVGGGR